MESTRLKFGAYELDVGRYELNRGGRAVKLERIPMELLLLLVERRGQLVTRDEIVAQLWGKDTFLDVDNSINTAILKLRRAFRDDPRDPKFIKTLTGNGYRFVAPVSVVPAEAAANPTAAAADSTETLPAAVEAVPATAPEPSSPAAPALSPTDVRVSKRGVKVIAGSVAVLLAVLAAWVWYSRSPARPSLRSIAVLPLQNLSGDPSQEYFADGMTDELITDLAQIHSLRVISRTSVMKFKQTTKKLSEIARELSVDAIVEGSVLRSGENIRVTAQLLDGRQDRHLWAASYERPLADVIGLQRQVAQAIAEQVRAELTPREHANLAKSHPTNAEAYQAMLKGRLYFNERNQAAEEKALEYFKLAVEIDPTNAEAWTGIAGVYASLGADLGLLPPGKVLPLAQAAIAKALAIDENLAEAHLQQAWIRFWFDWDWKGAETEFRRAIELNPGDSPAHRMYSYYLTLMARTEEALAEDRRAIDLAPLDTLPAIHLARIYLNARQPAKALEQSNRVLKMDPAFNGSYLFIARSYEAQKNWPEAIAAFEKTKSVYSVWYVAESGRILAESGRRTEADSSLKRLRELSQRTYVSPVHFATLHAALGERQLAFDWLEKAYRERATALAYLAVDYEFDSLRPDPRFQDLLRRVGFPASVK